jgi:hypothetical protein
MLRWEDGKNHNLPQDFAEMPGWKEMAAIEKCKQVSVVENGQAREKNTGIYLLTGAKDIFTSDFYKRVEERKNNLDIF